MSTFTIAIASEAEVREIALWRRMREFNYPIVGRYPEGQNVWLNAFYPRHGYRELTKIADYYQGHSLSLMAKELRG